MTVFEKFKKTKAFVFDVDGVLTNGEILVTENGEQLRTFFIKDGYALQLAVKRNFPIAVITGGKSQGIKSRMQGLGIKDVFTDISNKIEILNNWMAEHNLKSEDVLFMGDDIPDLEAMKSVGFATCPADAVEDIKAVSQYISSFNGGRGAVRDVIEKVMRLQDKWDKDTSIKSI